MSDTHLWKLHHADAFSWLDYAEPESFHAVVCDPPYALKDYSEVGISNLREGKGIWRLPPAYGDHQRNPLPRFTVLTEKDHEAIRVFFAEFAVLLNRVLVPGAHVFVASTPIISHAVISGFTDGDRFQKRGEIVRLVQTMRGGDRPKNAHNEFADTSVIPRGAWEPWLLFRKQLNGRIADNLKRWGTGALRRSQDGKPFKDVITSGITPIAEREIANHPSLKPQRFLREVVWASLPLGQGVILDPFAGSGSTLAAATALGLRSIGLERDEHYAQMALKAIPLLAAVELTPGSTNGVHSP